MVTKTWLDIFIWLSLIFLLISIKQLGYLQIPTIYSYRDLSLSLFLLLLGCSLQVTAWHKVLKLNGCNVSISHSISSIGLTVFGKYIPGKLWVVMGRAAYLSNVYPYGLKRLSAISLMSQMLAIYSGIVLGTFGLLFVNYDYYVSIILIIILLILLPLITPIVHGIVIRIPLFRSFIGDSLVSVKQIFTVLPWFMAFWLVWGVGFFYLSLSTTTEPVPPSTIMGFAVAGSAGILAFFVPGGLGVREGVLALYLMETGLSLTTATTISITSRLWFLVGELYIFSLGHIARK